jgi:hypothetical protein
VPGYTGDGKPIKAVDSNTVQNILNKPMYIPQFLCGGVTLAAGYYSVSISDTVLRSTARMNEIGTLYCAIAGMLNLFILIDSAHRCAKIRALDPDRLTM